jgi:hypothetical protein
MFCGAEAVPTPWLPKFRLLVVRVAVWPLAAPAQSAKAVLAKQGRNLRKIILEKGTGSLQALRSKPYYQGEAGKDPAFIEVLTSSIIGGMSWIRQGPKMAR